MSNTYKTAIGTITAQTQPRNNTSTHTCFSMITGIPVEDIIRRGGPNMSVNNPTAITILSESGLNLESKRIDINAGGGFRMDIYLMTVPSLTRIGALHTVILSIDTTSSKVIQIIDPNDGRPGEPIYTTRMCRLPEFEPLAPISHQIIDLPDHAARRLRIDRLREIANKPD